MINNEFLTEHHKGIVMGHLNVRSMWNKLDLIRATFTNSCFSLIGLSETWLTNLFDDSLLSIKGFNLFRLDRQVLKEDNTIKKGGGVCLYIKDSINTSLFELEDRNISTPHVECQWIELCFENQRNIIVGNIYRPPQGDIEEFTTYLDTCIENFDLANRDVYILGDINVDMLDKKHDSTKKLTECITQNGLLNFIKNPTRFDVNKNSCLDHIYTNSSKVYESGVLDVNISDHEMIYIIHKKKKTVPISAEFFGRSYRNYNCEQFVNNLNQQDWTEFNSATDPNLLWNIFYSHTTISIEQMCPLKNFKIKKFKDMWISDEILELIKEKDCALRKAKRTKSNHDWLLARRLRNLCVSRVRKAKSDFIKNELKT